MPPMAPKDSPRRSSPSEDAAAPRATPGSTSAPKNSVELQVISLAPAPPRVYPITFLVGLIPELQFSIFRLLDYVDIHRVRLTCRALRQILGYDAVTYLFGGLANLRTAQLNTCITCMQAIEPHNRILADPIAPNYPLASTCLSCAYKRNPPDVDKVITLGHMGVCYACRWCGELCEIPERRPRLGQDDFHGRCWRKLALADLAHRAISIADITCYLTSCPMICVRWQGHWQPVLATVMAMLMLGFAILLKNRYDQLRLYIYHVLLILDLIGLTIWSLVLAYIWNDTTIPRPSKGRDEYTILEVIIILTIIFRLLAALGYAMLMTNFKFWRHRRHGLMSPRGIWSRVQTLLMIWSNPCHIMYPWPPQERGFVNNVCGRFLFRLRIYGLSRKLLWPPTPPEPMLPVIRDREQ